MIGYGKQVMSCGLGQEPVKDPARLEWHEVTKVAHYYLSVNAMTRPMQVREDEAPYGRDSGQQGEDA